MTNATEFWWNWWITLGVAIGTIGAVFAALFGDWFQARFFPPNLVIDLVKHEGEACTLEYMLPIPGDKEGMMVPNGEERARYYHLRVTNLRRRASANNTLIYLSQIQVRDVDGIHKTVWTGDVSLKWRNSDYFKFPRTVGPSADSDLCCITCGEHTYKALGPQHESLKTMPSFSIFPTVRITNLERFQNHTGPISLILTVQARSDERDSTRTFVQINWDGIWVESDTDITAHMQIAVTDAEL